MNALRTVFNFGPLIFGIGFLAPLIDQSARALELSAPFGMTTLSFGLVIGAVLGGVATARGTWLL